MSFKKLLPSLLPLGSILLAGFTPALQHALAGFVTAHPAIASAIVSIGGFIYHLLPSPIQK